RNLGGLIDDLRPPEAEPLVEAAGAAVLGRYFEKDALDAGGLEAGQRMPEQNGAQTLAAMLWEDADVLNGADVVLGDALNRAAMFRPASICGPVVEEPR